MVPAILSEVSSMIILALPSVAFSGMSMHSMVCQFSHWLCRTWNGIWQNGHRFFSLSASVRYILPSSFFGAVTFSLPMDDLDICKDVALFFIRTGDTAFGVWALLRCTPSAGPCDFDLLVDWLISKSSEHVNSCFPHFSLNWSSTLSSWPGLQGNVRNDLSLSGLFILFSELIQSKFISSGWVNTSVWPSSFVRITVSVSWGSPQSFVSFSGSSWPQVSNSSDETLARLLHLGAGRGSRLFRLLLFSLYKDFRSSFEFLKVLLLLDLWTIPAVARWSSCCRLEVLNLLRDLKLNSSSSSLSILINTYKNSWRIKINCWQARTYSDLIIVVQSKTMQVEKNCTTSGALRVCLIKGHHSIPINLVSRGERTTVADSVVKCGCSIVAKNGK